LNITYFLNITYLIILFGEIGYFWEIGYFQILQLPILFLLRGGFYFWEIDYFQVSKVVYISNNMLCCENSPFLKMGTVIWNPGTSSGRTRFVSEFVWESHEEFLHEFIIYWIQRYPLLPPAWMGILFWENSLIDTFIHLKRHFFWFCMTKLANF
jgi:hypothetical protein